LLRKVYRGCTNNDGDDRYFQAELSGYAKKMRYLVRWGLISVAVILGIMITPGTDAIAAVGKVGPLKVGALKVGPLKVGPLKVGPGKVGSVKLTKSQQKMRDLKQSTARWIQVDLTKQRVIAWEGKRWVEAMIVSTGKADTPTVTGIYDIYIKHRETRMQGEDYDLSDVPYVMYFSGGYGFHGAYWHNSFGTPVSHGCVNLAVDKAKWLYDFASVGTTVVVHR
jgi:lipoprotein-anchoring transpeptidase ErfK/SrfK